MKLALIPRWFRSSQAPCPERRAARAHALRLRLTVENLEDRSLPAVVFTPGPYTVPDTSAADTALGSPTSFRPVEPYASVNPVDPGQIAVSSHNGIRLSTDGGVRFTNTITFPNSSGGDTTTVYDHAGRLFWLNIASGISIEQLDPATGARVAGPFAVDNGPDDKPFLAADPTTNNLFVIWTGFPSSGGTQILLRRSTDQGATWSDPVRVDNGADGFVWPASVAVAPDGFVYAAYHSVLGFSNNAPNHTGRIVVVRYNNDLTAPVRTLAEDQGFADITFNVQTSGTARTIPGMQFWTQGAGQPQVLPDPARPGNVYVVSADSTSPTNDKMVVRMARSTDDGRSWDPSTVVVSGPGDSYALFPQAAIDDFGDIVIAWYDDRRGLTNAAGHFELDVFAEYSTDGGLTFSPDFMVNSPDNPFDPDVGAITRFAGPPPTTRIGEYFGLALFGGTAYVAWNGDLGTRSEQVFFKSFPIAGSLTVTGAGVQDAVTVQTTPGNAAFAEVIVNGQRQYAGYGSALSGVSIAVSAGDADISVADNAAGVPVTVNVGDTSGTLDPIGTVTVADASGTATVNLDDTGFTGSEDYVITGNAVTISRSAAFALIYRGIAGLNLTAGDGGDTFDIDGTSAGTTVTGGAGPNVFHVSPFTQWLAGSLGGFLTLNGNGADVLEFFDANDPNSETFSFDPVPMSLTLGATGTTVADFSGMAAVYVTTNGFSTPDDQSGTVIFDPDGGPPGARRPPRTRATTDEKLRDLVFLSVAPVSPADGTDYLPCWPAARDRHTISLSLRTYTDW